MAQHICSTCNGGFDTEQQYLDHVCPGSGFKPTRPEHQGPEFASIQKAALERGKAKLEDPEAVARQDAAIAETEAKIEASHAAEPAQPAAEELPPYQA